jgi:hypothetical protein
MNEHQILYKGDMVRAILDGRKTKTRRVMSSQPPIDDGDILVGTFNPTRIDRQGEEYPGDEIFGAYSEYGQWGLKCRYGKPGDLLWVREAWRVIGWRDGEAFVLQYRADGQKLADMGGNDYDDQYERLCVQSCEDCEKAGFVPDAFGVYSWPEDVEAPTRWRPSIHMPKWACRLWLKVLSVRVERVQEISLEDCAAEGIDSDPRTDWLWQFTDLWDSINAKPCPVYVDKKIVSYVSYPWEDIQEMREHRGKPWHVCGNPFVWVIEFERVEH